MAHSTIVWDQRCVYLVTSKDGGVLFDLDNDKFLKLDPIGAQIWTLLSLGQSQPEVAGIIARKYQTDTKRVVEDIGKLLNAAAELDIVPQSVHLPTSESSPSSSSSNAMTFPWYGQDASVVRPEPRPATIVGAFLTLALFDLILSVRSFKSLCRIVSQCRVAPTKPADTDLIGRICTAVERACVWYPKRAVCLQRSAVTTWLLRRNGAPAKLVVAARVLPMLSHAWVEVSGAVVNDHPKVTVFYQTLARF